MGFLLGQIKVPEKSDGQNVERKSVIAATDFLWQIMLKHLYEHEMIYI